MPKFNIKFTVTETHEQNHTVNAETEELATHQAITMFNRENKDLHEQCVVEVTVNEQ